MADLPKSNDDIKVGDIVYFYGFDLALNGRYGSWSTIHSAEVIKSTPKMVTVNYTDLKDGASNTQLCRD